MVSATKAINFLSVLVSYTCDIYVGVVVVVVCVRTTCIVFATNDACKMN